MRGQGGVRRTGDGLMQQLLGAGEIVLLGLRDSSLFAQVV